MNRDEIIIGLWTFFIIVIVVAAVIAVLVKVMTVPRETEIEYLESKRDILDKMLCDDDTIYELTSEQLIELINDGTLTARVYNMIEEEYCRRLT